MPPKATMSAAYDHREEMKKRPKVLDHLRIKAGEKGGHVVEHHFENYEHAPETHPFGDGQGIDMLTHVAKAMKVKPPKEETEPDEDD